jgi:FixJ family two-component response regulator/AraC-like DNA-binding protein
MEPRLLWIDDEIRATDPCVALLKSEGYDVDCVASGENAVAHFQNVHYDGVILDQRLARESGLDLLEVLLVRRPGTPVLVLTGWADWESGVTAMKRGAADYRSKTTMLTDEWLGCISTMMARTRRETEVLRRLEAIARYGDDQQAVLLTLLTTLLDGELTPPVFLAVQRALRQVLSAAAPVAHGSVEASAIIRRDSRTAFDPQHPLVKALLGRLKSGRAARRWSEAAMAREFAASPSHFGRMVRTRTGLGFRELRAAVAMQAAVREILLSDEQFAVIGWRLGFEHASQFSREVGDTFGLAPRELRDLWKRLAAERALAGAAHA